AAGSGEEGLRGRPSPMQPEGTARPRLAPNPGRSRKENTPMCRRVTLSSGRGARDKRRDALGEYESGTSTPTIAGEVHLLGKVLPGNRPVSTLGRPLPRCRAGVPQPL